MPTVPTTDEPDDVDRLLDTVHLADSAFWRADPAHRHAVFAALRERPVRWYPPRRSEFVRPSTGFWALTRHADVWRASRAPQVFCSGRGIDIEESPPELEGYLSSMITMDDPQHHRLRRLVSAAFAPRHVERLDAHLRAVARDLVDAVVDRFGDGSEFDVVEHLAAPLPLRAIGDLMGIPTDEQAQVFTWTNTMVAPDEPSNGVAAAAAASRDMATYALALGADRRRRPTEDLTSVLMRSEVDGERLAPDEFANFFLLLVTAGNETTRNAISHALRLLTLHPEQRRRWFGDVARHTPTAVDEVVRYETPITHMCRTVTEDVTFDDVRIPAGDKVALWYTAANRDPAVFDEPDRFDVARPVHPQHTGFGGGGPHFCLGAHLARREVAVMIDEIRRRLPGLAVTGEPERVLSMSLNAIGHLPASVHAAPP